MRRIFEWVGGFAIVAFSFYFTDKVSLLVAGKSELMQEIKAVSSVYEETAVDAIIDEEDNTIVPGLFGRTVNREESYMNMHDFGSFNENYLIYDYIKPEKSLDDNKDKFIKSGNKNKRQVSIIVDENEEALKYLKDKKIVFNMTTREIRESDESIELINSASTKDKFNSINSKLKNESKLCLKDIGDMNLCKKNGYYLVDAKIKLNASNMLEVKNAIGPGSIILLTSSAKVSNIEILLNELEYKDLEVVHISQLIDEKERAR